MGAGSHSISRSVREGCLLQPSPSLVIIGVGSLTAGTYPLWATGLDRGPAVF